MSDPFNTRFAPSPTGPLHLGHAYSAILAHDMAVTSGGRFLLRMEDIDQSRARALWEEQIYDDLSWLGLSWETPVLRQSKRFDLYSDVLDQLWSKGLLYPCVCKRADIELALGAPQEGIATPLGPDGPVYPGTCRPPAPPSGPRPKNEALRLNISIALKQLSAEQETLKFLETGHGPTGQTGEILVSHTDLLETVGDIVLCRRDMGTSYHLSVTLDDAAQNITHIVRGNDLFEATKIHILLQSLLNLPTPIYHHHRLIRDDKGKRLAKRDDARAIAKYREDGASPADIRAMVGLDRR